MNREIRTDAERPAGKLDPKGRLGVHVTVSSSREAEARHRRVEARKLDTTIEHEVEIL